MTKSERLFQIMSLMRKRRTAIRAQDLADRLGVSERTIYRDIEALILSGAHIEGEAGVGYRLRAESEIPPLMFTEKEVEALMLGMRVVKSWADDEIGESAQKALQKIRSALPENLLAKLDRAQTKFVVPDFYKEDRVKFSKVFREGIDQSKATKIAYQDVKGKDSTRIVYPLGLVFWGATWTLVAWCTLRDDYRLFRLDRMQNAVLTDQPFETHATLSFQDYLNQQREAHGEGAGPADLSFW